jgi:hypothetical protein
MNDNVKDLIRNSPSISSSQVLTDMEMSTLEGGCTIICSSSCALGCSQSGLWNGKPKTTTAAPTTAAPEVIEP